MGTLTLLIGTSSKDFRTKSPVWTVRSTKKPRRSGAPITEESTSSLGLCSRDVRRLQALRALDHIELHSLPFRESTEPVRLNLTEVHEEIFSLRLFDKTVALFGTKPLDSPLSQPCNLHVFRGDTATEPTPL
jgi:hypothetical protein